MAEEVGDAERLVVLLEARIRDFEKNMAKASGTATKSYGGMRRDSKTATQQMEADMNRTSGSINRALAATSTKIGTFGKSLIAGFAGGLVAGGVAGMVSQIGQIANAVASVGDEAKRAGVGVEAFQELAYVARQNRIGVDALTDGLKELNLRADEFIVTGAGSAAEAFTRLGYTAEELNEKLKDPSALFTEIIGKLKQLDQAAQIRIADEIFGGTGGEQFVQLIQQGEDGLKRTIQQARDLGQVLDQETIARANDLDQAFKDITNTVGVGLQQAIVNATWALFDFLQQFKAVEERTTASLDQRLSDLGRKIVELDREAMQADSDSRSDPAKASLYTGFATQAREEIAALREEEARILQILEERKKPLNSPTASPVPTVPGSGASSSGRDREADAIKRQEDAVKNLIAGLEFEKSLIGLSALEQQKLTTLRQAGAAATDEQRAQISRLIEETHAEQTRVDSLKNMYDALGEAGVGAFEGIIGAMQDGKIEAHELLSIGLDLLRTFAGAGVGNPLASLASSLFGGGLKIPGFKDGGAGVVPGSGPPDSRLFVAKVSPGEPYAFGPQAVRGTGGGSQNVHVTVGVSADGNGNLMPFVKEVVRNEAGPMAQQAARYGAAQAVSEVRQNFASWQSDLSIHGAI